jgi:hypothetical protein
MRQADLEQEGEMRPEYDVSPLKDRGAASMSSDAARHELPLRQGVK